MFKNRGHSTCFSILIFCLMENGNDRLEKCISKLVLEGAKQSLGTAQIGVYESQYLLLRCLLCSY